VSVKKRQQKETRKGQWNGVGRCSACTVSKGTAVTTKNCQGGKTRQLPVWRATESGDGLSMTSSVLSMGSRVSKKGSYDDGDEKKGEVSEFSGTLDQMPR